MRGFIHHFTEGIFGKCIHGTNDRMRESLRRSLLQRQVMTRAETRINRERNRERHRRFLVEDRDFLFVPVLVDYKIFLGQPRHRSPVSVGYRHEDVDQLDVHLQGVNRFGLALAFGVRGRFLLSWGLLRPKTAPERAKKNEQAYSEQTRGGFSHRVMELYLVKSASLASPNYAVDEKSRLRAVHLDASPLAGLP